MSRNVGWRQLIKNFEGEEGLKKKRINSGGWLFHPKMCHAFRKSFYASTVSVNGKSKSLRGISNAVPEHLKTVSKIFAEFNFLQKSRCRFLDGKMLVWAAKDMKKKSEIWVKAMNGIEWRNGIHRWLDVDDEGTFMEGLLTLALSDLPIHGSLFWQLLERTFYFEQL